jgi:hypothetical protein
VCVCVCVWTSYKILSDAIFADGLFVNEVSGAQAVRNPL